MSLLKEHIQGSTRLSGSTKRQTIRKGGTQSHGSFVPKDRQVTEWKWSTPAVARQLSQASLTSLGLPALSRNNRPETQHNIARGSAMPFFDLGTVQVPARHRCTVGPLAGSVQYAARFLSLDQKELRPWFP